jgi:hypothetical protein
VDPGLGRDVDKERQPGARSRSLGRRRQTVTTGFGAGDGLEQERGEKGNAYGYG